MVRQDIVVGLKNSIERGYSLQQSMITLINSGYNREEVESAARYLTGGFNTTPESAINYVNSSSQLQKPNQYSQYSQQSQQIIQSPIQALPSMPVEIPIIKKHFPWKMVSLVIILLILIGVLIFSLVFKETLIDFLKELFRR